MSYYVKESFRDGERLHERAVRVSPFKNLDAAARLMNKSAKEDNLPFVAKESGEVVLTGKRGKRYG